MKVLFIKLFIDLVALLLLWKILAVPLPEYVFIVLILIGLSISSAYKTMIGFFDAFQTLRLLLIIITLGAVHTVFSDMPTIILTNLYALSFIILLVLRLSFFAYRNKHLMSTRRAFRSRSNSAVIVGAGEASRYFWRRRSPYNTISSVFLMTMREREGGAWQELKSSVRLTTYLALCNKTRSTILST